MLARWAITRLRASAASICSCSAVPEVALTTAPICVSRATVSGACSALFAAARSLSATAGGVLAGITSANQVMPRSFSAGWPSSFIVGTLGSSARRLGAITASALSLPDFTCCSTDGAWSISTCTVPAMASVCAGPMPRYGIGVTFTPSASFIASSIRWPMLPMPGTAAL